MTTQYEIKQLESGIKQAKEVAELGNSLERLQSNRDFKRVIGEGYFEQESIRLVHLKADANMQTVELQQSIVRQMDAIGALKVYFRVLMQRSGMALRTIEEDEETLNELLNGEAAI